MAYHISEMYIWVLAVNSFNLGGGKILYKSKVQFMPHSMVVAHPKSTIDIGEGCEISMYSRVASLGYVKLGNNVLMGPHVFIADYNHEYHDILRPIKFQGNSIDRPNDDSPVLSIDDGTWLGTNVVVVGNIHIGKNCVIGANSVVTRDIPNYSVAVGIPAKVIKTYNLETNKWEKV